MKKIIFTIFIIINVFITKNISAQNTCPENSEPFFDDCICISGYLKEGDNCIVIKDDPIIYEEKNIKINNTNINFHLLKIDINKVDIITDTANSINCKNNCNAKPLKNYVEYFKADVGINGSYFCPKDYKNCYNKINSFFYPVYNTNKSILINESEMKWIKNTIGFIGFDKYKNYISSNSILSDRVKKLEDIENKYNIKINSLISSEPVLISDGKNILNKNYLDNTQQTKTLRSGIGIKNNFVYLIVSKKSSVLDLANLFEYYNVDFAMNLDGGGSSSLYYQNKYIVGPGRNIPNSILFKIKK